MGRGCRNGRYVESESGFYLYTYQSIQLGDGRGVPSIDPIPLTDDDADMGRLDIPAEQAVLIPQIAPLSSVQIAEKQAELEEQQSRWGYRKRLYRESKNRRRLFW